MKFLVALSCVLALAAAKPNVEAPVAPVANLAPVAPLAYGYSTNVVAPALSYAAPAVSYAAPAVSYAAPALSYAAPALSYAAPAVRYAAPAVAYTAPAVSTVSVAQGVAAPVVSAPVVSSYAAPAVAAVAPVVAAPVVQKSQYHAQDEFGQASYGHAEPFQTHTAVQDAAGNKAGSFSYVNPNGEVVATNYVADALGYRVASNALPVAPAVPEVAPAVLPVAPAETPEVAAARAAHLDAHAEARSRSRRDVSVIPAPVVYHAPVTHFGYTAPVFRAATLRTVVNTPAHAVSYRVY